VHVIAASGHHVSTEAAHPLAVAFHGVDVGNRFALGFEGGGFRHVLAAALPALQALTGMKEAFGLLECCQ
jgi:hypothetical protein